MSEEIAKEIGALEKLAKVALGSVDTIQSDLTFNRGSWEAYEDAYFFVIESEFRTLGAVIALNSANQFKECMILLRSAFERSLYFWLMLEGEEYKWDPIWNITPNPGNTNPAARDSTLQMWKKNWKEGKTLYKDVVGIDPVGDDSIRVTFLLRGLYDEKDIEKKGTVIPWYLAVVDEYNPDIKFLSELPSISVGDMFPEVTSQHKKIQDSLYNRYFYFPRIVENLLLNKLITKPQDEYILVHYSYLSSFVHPSRRSLKPMVGESYLANKSSDYVRWLILLYVCRVMIVLLRAILTRFKRTNPKALVTRYEQVIQNLEKETLYFWFIDNSPTQEDIESSDQKKAWLEDPERKNDPTVIYEPDPLKRLETLGYALLTRKYH